MKLVLLVLVIATACLAQVEPTNQLTRSGSAVVTRLAKAKRSWHPLLLADEDRKMPVLIMEPLQSRLLRDLLPRFTTYRLICSHDIIHSARFTALLVDTNSAPTHLQSDEEVANFLGALTSNVKTTNDALRLVRAFADLRSYPIVETPPNFTDARKRDEHPAPLETDYKFFAEEREREWRVYVTFFTSEYSGSYDRYMFSIWKPPGGGIRLADPVLIRLRNYVY